MNLQRAVIAAQSRSHSRSHSAHLKVLNFTKVMKTPFLKNVTFTNTRVRTWPYLLGEYNSIHSASYGFYKCLHYIYIDAYLGILVFLPATLILACASSRLAFCMMYSTYKLNKQGDNI